VKQIETLAAMKSSFSPAQKKIDSQLIFATKQETGEMAALGLDSLQVDVKRNDAGKVLVDITANVTETLLSLVKAHGGNIVSAVPNYRSVRAEIALSQLESIAALRVLRSYSRHRRRPPPGAGHFQFRCGDTLGDGTVG
jgi:hypothetical protein